MQEKPECSNLNKPFSKDKMKGTVDVILSV